MLGGVVRDVRRADSFRGLNADWMPPETGNLARVRGCAGALVVLTYRSSVMQDVRNARANRVARTVYLCSLPLLMYVTT